MATARPSSIEVSNPHWSGARRVIGVLATLTVLGLVVGLAGLFGPARVSYPDGSTKSTREAAISAANDFAVAYNTYDVAKLDDYQKRVGSMLTDSYRKEFDKITDSIFTALTVKKQTSGDAKVLQIAVDTIDSDSADLLVAVDAQLKNTDNENAVPRNMRWQVSLVLEDGKWKIDKFESVSALQAETAAPATEEGDSKK